MQLFAILAGGSSTMMTLLAAVTPSGQCFGRLIIREQQEKTSTIRSRSSSRWAAVTLCSPLILLSGVAFGGEQIFNASDSFAVPDAVSKITVEAWGGAAQVEGRPSQRLSRSKSLEPAAEAEATRPPKLRSRLALISP